MTKKWIVTITMTLAATLLPVPSFSADNNFDWKEFLGQYDMLWDNEVIGAARTATTREH